MNKIHTLTLRALACFCTFFLFGIAPALAQSNAGADIDTRWHRDVAAGPYSSVSTAYGGMATHDSAL